MNYLFVCVDCNRIFNFNMSLTQYIASTIHHCPNCKSTNTRRFFSEVPAVSYKDDGFTKYIPEED